MLLMQDFVVGGKEYLVMDSMSSFRPGAAAIRLLAHRRDGVGADRVLLRIGHQADAREAFVAFRADGTAGKVTAEDLQVLLHAVPSCEMRLTASFVQRLREADAAAVAEQFLAS